MLPGNPASQATTSDGQRKAQHKTQSSPLLHATSRELCLHWTLRPKEGSGQSEESDAEKQQKVLRDGRRGERSSWDGPTSEWTQSKETFHLARCSAKGTSPERLEGEPEASRPAGLCQYRRDRNCRAQRGAAAAFRSEEASIQSSSHPPVRGT